MVTVLMVTGHMVTVLMVTVFMVTVLMVTILLVTVLLVTLLMVTVLMGTVLMGTVLMVTVLMVTVLIPGSKEKLGQRHSYIASVVGMTLATDVGSTFILWKSSLPCIPTLGWRQNPRSFRPLDVGPTS